MSFSHQKKRKRGSKRSHDICGTKEPEPDEFHIQPTKKRRQSGDSSLTGRRGFITSLSSSSMPTRVVKKQTRKRPPTPLDLEEIEQRKRQTEQDVAVLVNGGVVNIYIHPPFNGDRNYQNLRKTEHRPGSGIPFGVGLGLHKSGGCHDRDNWNNPHYARGTLHDVLDADSYKTCDKIAREILKQNAGDVIVNVYMKSNLIGCIFSSLESENEATRLTATLLSVLPYVRKNPNNNRHGIRRVSDLIRKNPQLDLMLQHLSMGLQQPSKTVLPYMKTWIVHALADIMECLYDATKSRASQPDPITVRYRLIEPALQIMLCAQASPMVQAFATRLLTTHIHYGPECRKELVRFSALGIVTSRLPLLPENGANHTNTTTTTTGAQAKVKENRRRRLSDGENGCSEDSKDREPSCSSSNPEEEDSTKKLIDGDMMGYYLHTLIMKFCYIAYSHEEFFLADDPTDYIPIDHQGNPTHDSRVHAARNAPPGGVFIPDVVSSLRDKCERLSSQSSFYEVRAAAKLLLTYSLGARAGIRRPVEPKDSSSCRDSRDVGRRVQLRSPKWELKFTDLCEEERACMDVDVDPFMSTQHTNRSKRKR